MIEKFKETDTHIYFWDSYLSNWHRCLTKIKYNGLLFANSEQLFMYLKAMHFNDAFTAQEILDIGDDPKIAKELGKKVSNFDSKEWDGNKERCMYVAVYNKFKTNDDIKAELIRSHPKTLVEGSPHDRIWGVGLHWKDEKILDDKNWKGQNLLGKTLMKVRDELKSQYDARSKRS